MFFVFYSTKYRRFLTFSRCIDLMSHIFTKILDISIELFEITRSVTVLTVLRSDDVLQTHSSACEL